MGERWKRACAAARATQETGLSKRALLTRIIGARANVSAEIAASASGGKFARGLASEGFVGGYLAALDDIEALLRHGYPQDARGFWKIPPYRNEAGMSRTEQDPVETPGSLGGAQFNHPAYGVIRTSQPSGNTTLFGSDFLHRNYVTLTICEAHLDRTYHEDRIFGEKIIVQIDMSEAQWAHFVSAHGKYQGTPVTLRHIPERPYKLEHVPGIPHRIATDQFSPEADARVQDVMDQLNKLEAELTIGLSKLSQKDRDKALAHVHQAKMQIGPNLKFVSDQMTEHLEEKVTAAKIEVYAWMNNAVRSAGLSAIAGQAQGEGPILIEAPSPIAGREE